MPLTLEAFGIDKLTAEERRELIALIRDSLPDEDDGDAVSPGDIPDWHIALLEKRLTDAEANPGAGRPWREVLDSLGAKE